jgi:hypothetical protein
MTEPVVQSQKRSDDGTTASDLHTSRLDLSKIAKAALGILPGDLGTHSGPHTLLGSHLKMKLQLGFHLQTQIVYLGQRMQPSLIKLSLAHDGHLLRQFSSLG